MSFSNFSFPSSVNPSPSSSTSSFSPCSTSSFSSPSIHSLHSTIPPFLGKIPFRFSTVESNRRNSIVLFYPQDYIETTLNQWTKGYTPWLWIICSLSCPVLFIYLCILSKYQSTTGIWLLDAIQRDHFYCYLIPLLIPVFSFHVAWNWLGLKLFQQN